VISGAVDWEAGLELVVERGRLMAQIQQRHPGSMAAIVGIRPERLVALCETASECGLVTVANLNSPMQSVVAGDPAAVERVIALARAAGAKATMRLQVGAAFHTPRMQPVRAQLAERMEGVRWRDPAIPMVANASGTLLTRGDEVKHALLAQIVCPVQWIACVTTLRDAGCTRFLQLGPGRVVSGLVRQIDREVDAVAAESPSRIARLAREHAEAT
jgi:[acyl-carrier-protein] S-malonyltransferase